MAFLNYTDPVPTPAPLTSGSTIQSYTDPTGEVWVAKNGVNSGAWKRARDVLHGRIYRTAAWTSSSTIGVFGMDTTDRDPYGMYGSSGFIVPIAGLYLVQSKVSWASSNTAQIFWLAHYVAGASQVSSWQIPGNANAWPVVLMASTLAATAGQSVQTWHASNTAGITGNAGLSSNFMTIDYLGTG